jgi:hypothetical protein
METEELKYFRILTTIEQDYLLTPVQKDIETLLQAYHRSQHFEANARIWYAHGQK